MSVVMKFGGTSVADAAALRRVLKIISTQHELSGGLVCVVSATSGTTNELLALAQYCALPSASVQERCAPILQRHLDIVADLIPTAIQPAAQQRVQEVVAELERYCEGMRILEECTPTSMDAVASFGERLSSAIVTHALSACGIDVVEIAATDVVRTDSVFMRATADMLLTAKACEAVMRPLLDAGRVVVTQGFAGSDAEGRTTTLGRGGSDASAAIIGAAVGAERIEIWTDVSGVYSADPRIISAAHAIPSLSFGEIRELALYGAKVLHPDTILPAVEHGIPVFIKNTFDALALGTVITKQVVAHGVIHAVSLMRPCSVITGDRTELERLRQSEQLHRRILLDCSSREHSLIVVHASDADAATDVAVAVAGTTLHTQSCAVVVCTGPRVQLGTTVASIVNRLAEFEVTGVFTGVSPWSVFALVDLSNADLALALLHELTLL